MSLTEQDLARQTPDGLQIRTAALRVTWNLSDLRGGDGHRVDVKFSASVRALSEPVEQRMLKEVFLSRADVVQGHDVAAHFDPALRETALRCVANQPGNFWIEAGNARLLIDALLAGAKPVAFNCGIEFLEPYAITTASPTIERQKLEDFARQQMEKRAAGQAQLVQRSVDLLKQFTEAQKSHPELSVSHLLQQLPEMDRASTLHSLLLASAEQETPRMLLAVAGESLLRIDPRVSPAKAEIFDMSTELGPLRSVHRREIDGQSACLIGARSGVIRLDPRDFAKPGRLYCDHAMTSQRGFTQVIVSNGSIWACHGDAGIVAWAIDTPDAPRLTLRPGSKLGAVTVLDPKWMVALDGARIAVAVGADVVILSDDGSHLETLPGSVAIIATIEERTAFWVIHADGRAIRRDTRTLEVLADERRITAPTAVAGFPFLSTTRLLIGDASGRIQCLGSDDDQLSQFASPYGETRILAATTDLIATVSADRQRIVWWFPWDGRKLAGELHVASIARHRVADIDFV